MTQFDVAVRWTSLMQQLVPQCGNDSPDMNVPRAALLKRLNEVATKEWLNVLRESTAILPCLRITARLWRRD